MKIAVVGATGKAGSRIVNELLSRGHTVTGIARNPETLPDNAKLTKVKGDAEKPDDLAKKLAGHDAIVSSVRFSGSDADKLIHAVKASGVKRYVVVGGTGSLNAPGGAGLFLNAPGFPEVARAEATAGYNFLEKIRKESTLDWVVVSPGAMFTPGERTANSASARTRRCSIPTARATSRWKISPSALSTRLRTPSTTATASPSVTDRGPLLTLCRRRLSWPAPRALLRAGTPDDAHL